MEPLRPVEDETLLRMVRYALATGATQLHFRPGCLPLVDGPGGARQLRYRQLTGDDTGAIAEHLLERVRVSERLREGAADAGCELPVLVELPGRALLEARFLPAPGGVQVSIDLIRPLARTRHRDWLEG